MLIASWVCESCRVNTPSTNSESRYFKPYGSRDMFISAQYVDAFR